MSSRIIAPSRLRLRTTCNIQYERVNGQQVRLAGETCPRVFQAKCTRLEKSHSLRKVRRLHMPIGNR